MAYHSPVHFKQRYTMGKSRIVYCCFKCEKPIAPDQLRVKAKRNPYECWHSECFKEEYGIEITK